MNDVKKMDEKGFMVARIGDRGINLLSVPDECRVNIHAYDGII
jgi:hypothetical protein